jgi:hypothetical protein
MIQKESVSNTGICSWQKVFSINRSAEWNRMMLYNIVFLLHGSHFLL